MGGRNCTAALKEQAARQVIQGGRAFRQVAEVSALKDLSVRGIVFVNNGPRIQRRGGIEWRACR